MNNFKLRIFSCFVLFSYLCVLYAKTNFEVYDKQGITVADFFSQENVTYVIRYNHAFSDSVVIPKGCELSFRGGALRGRMFFTDTKLSGDVDIRGSMILGQVKNEYMNASWLCAMDGIQDDAKSINEMIQVCGKVFFPKGKYRLITRFNPSGKVKKKLHKSIKAHIGICKSNVELVGEQGTNFVTDEALGTICMFSKPNKISKSIRNIKIKNITFNVHNDGMKFHEFFHTIKTIGVNGLKIENCTFNDFWGDAICLSHYGDNPETGERTRNQNVEILNNAIIGGNHHSNRNGISVISGQNVVIKGNIIKNVSRKDMPGGIDIEPNNSAYTIENILVENNDIEGVVGSAISLHISKGAPGHHVCIQSNRIRKCTRGLSVTIRTENTSDSIIIRNNYVDNFTRPYRFVGKGSSKKWIVSDNVFERACIQNIPGDIKVKKLVVRNNKKKE